ncbi:fimbria/pilus periplasmic chaperone [Endozoicomonadaceae bacterium StTr2]
MYKLSARIVQTIVCWKITIVIQILLTLSSLPVQSAMVLDRIIVYFEPKDARLQDIQVFNPDPENLYLKTDVFRVLNPGTDNEKRVPPSSSDQIQLLVTPHKAVMPPQTQRIFRLYSRSKPDATETVYRVLFTPETGPIKEGQQGVKLLISYEVLVFIRPENPHYDLQARRDGKQIMFSNLGNINVLIRNGSICNRSKPSECSQNNISERIYAGQTWTIDATDNEVARLGLFDGYKENIRYFDTRDLSTVNHTPHRRGPAAVHAR